MAEVKITPDMLASEIGRILAEYGEEVFIMTEEGLDEAEKILLKNLKSGSPKGKTGNFAKSWKSTRRKYKLLRIIGNTKTVKTNKGKDIPLVNIFEYAKNAPNQPFIGKIYDDSADEMAEAVVKSLKRGG